MASTLLVGLASMLVGLASAKAEQKVKESCCSEKSGKTWHGSFQTPAQVCCVIRVTIRWTGVFRIYPPRTWTPRREVVEMLGLARKGMSGTAARSGRTLNMRFISGSYGENDASRPPSPADPSGVSYVQRSSFRAKPVDARCRLFQLFPSSFNFPLFTIASPGA